MPDGIIWLTRDPAPVLDGRDVEITFTSKVRECTYRMARSRARALAAGIVLMLDEDERKPSNVRPIKRRPAHG